MPSETDLDVSTCAVCGHGATLHSNEACEAIRCECHLTRKMLVREAKKPPAEPVHAPAPAVVPEDTVRTRSRRRRRRRAVQSDQDVAVVA
jgi:hypothetical protein